MPLHLQTLLEAIRLAIVLGLLLHVWRFARIRGLLEEMAFRALLPGLTLIACAHVLDFGDNYPASSSVAVAFDGAAAQIAKVCLYLSGVVLALLGIWNVLPLFDRLAERTRALEQSRSLQHAITEQAPDLLMLIDAATGEVVDCNPRALELIGISREDFVGRPLREFMPERQPDGRPSTEFLRVVGAAARREPQTEVRAAWNRADGSVAESIGSVGFVVAGDREYFQIRGRMRNEGSRGLTHALADVAASLSTAVGEEYFVELARSIARIFDAEHVLVGRFCGAGFDELETLAHLAPGALYRDVVTRIGREREDMPFVPVRLGQVRVFAGNLQDQYPQVEWFRENGITSWLGVPALGRDGDVVGVIALFGTRPLADPLQVEYVVQIFASRVAAEIERRDTLAVLRRSEADLRMALGASETALWAWDPASGELRLARVPLQRDAALHETRGTLEQWLGAHPGQREAVERQLRDAVGSGSAVRFEFFGGTESQDRWFEAVGSVQVDRGGGKHVRGIVQDVTERRHLLEALATSEQRLMSAMADSDSAVWEWVPASDRLAVFANDGNEFFRVARTLPTMRSFVERRTPGERALFEQQLDRALRGDGQFEAEFSVHSAERGEKRWFRCTGRLERGEGGEPRLLRGMVQDVSQEMARRAELLALTERLQLAMRVTGALVWEWTPATDALLLADNRSYAGQASAPATLTDWFALVPEQTRERLRTVLDHAIGTRAIERVDFLGVDTFGEARWREATISPQLDAHGEVERVIGVVRDIDERRRVQDAFATLARASTGEDIGSFLRTIVSSLVALFDVDVVSLEQFLPGDEPCMRVIGEWENGGFVPEYRYPLAGTPEEVVIRERRVFASDDVTTDFPDDPWYHQRRYRGYLSTPLIGASGEAIGLISLIHSQPVRVPDWSRALLQVFAERLAVELDRDAAMQELRAHRAGLEMLVEERTRRLERQTDALERSSAELAELASELEAFSYSVSHDLRGPLRAIDGFSRALEEDCAHELDATGLGYLGRIRAASGRMGQLIDDLLAFARISRREPDRALVDLAQLAEEAVGRLRDGAPGRVVEIRLEQGLQCEGDRGLLSIVMDNLIGNAWKYTGRTVEPRIEIGAEAAGSGGRVFYVRDNGAGFDMRFGDRLFGVFQRLHQQGEFEGTGVGLATVKRIIQRHGGRVWAEGEPGKGACFRFTVAPDESAALNGVSEA